MSLSTFYIVGFCPLFRLWDFLLWDSVLWDFVRRDFVLWDFVLWDSVRGNMEVKYSAKNSANNILYAKMIHSHLSITVYVGPYSFSQVSALGQYGGKVFAQGSKRQLDCI